MWIIASAFGDDIGPQVPKNEKQKFFHILYLKLNSYYQIASLFDMYMCMGWLHSLEAWAYSDNWRPPPAHPPPPPTIAKTLFLDIDAHVLVAYCFH